MTQKDAELNPSPSSYLGFWPSPIQRKPEHRNICRNTGPVLILYWIYPWTYCKSRCSMKFCGWEKEEGEKGMNQLQTGLWQRINALCCQIICFLKVPNSYFSMGFIYLFTFWPNHGACGILVPRTGIKAMPPALEMQSLINHRTTREVPRFLFWNAKIFNNLKKIVHDNKTCVTVRWTDTLWPLEVTGHSWITD